MRRKLREREKRECVRGVKDERADNLNDKGEVRDLRHQMVRKSREQAEKHTDTYDAEKQKRE